MIVTCDRCGHDLWGRTPTAANAALTRHQRTCRTTKENKP